MQAAAQTYKSGFPETFEEEPEAALKRRLEWIEHHKEQHIGPPDLLYMQRMVVVGGATSPQLLSSYHHCVGVDCSNTATIAAHITHILQHERRHPAAPTSLFRRRATLASTKDTGRIFRVVYCTFNGFTGRDLRVEAHMPGSVRSYSVGVAGDVKAVGVMEWLQVNTAAAVRCVLYGGDVRDRHDLVNFATTSDCQKEALLAGAGVEEIRQEYWRLGSPEGPVVRVPSLRRNCVLLAVQRLALVDPHFMYRFGECFGDCSLKAHSMFALDQQSKAIELLHVGLCSCGSNNSNILLLQALFLARHKRNDDAMVLLKRAVAMSPEDADLWIALADLQVSCGLLRDALWTVNNVNLDLGFSYSLSDLSIEPLHVHRPTAAEYWDDLQDLQDSPLVNLRADTLSGTALVVYRLLCVLVERVGWEGVLELRQSCFVMQQDYHYYRACDTSVTGTDVTDIGTDTTGTDIGTDVTDKEKITTKAALSPLTRAVIMSEKRVCERWLDDMFGMLYDDLRVYSVFTAELAMATGTSGTSGKLATGKYKRTLAEWARLGSLCERMMRWRDAVGAWECVVAERPHLLPALRGLVTCYDVLGCGEKARDTQLAIDRIQCAPIM